jgi:hypothetical protein
MAPPGIESAPTITVDTSPGPDDQIGRRESMRKLAVLSVLFLVFALGIPAVGQQDPGSISRLFLVKAKPGMEQQFEEGYKKHIAWHREQKDSWTWDTWVYETGEAFGQ